MLMHTNTQIQDTTPSPFTRAVPHSSSKFHAKDPSLPLPRTRENLSLSQPIQLIIAPRRATAHFCRVGKRVIIHLRERAAATSYITHKGGILVQYRGTRRASPEERPIEEKKTQQQQHLSYSRRVDRPRARVC